MTVAELKAHLQERGIKAEGVLEKQELVELALSHNSRHKKEVDHPSQDMSEHLLEC